MESKCNKQNNKQKKKKHTKKKKCNKNKKRKRKTDYDDKGVETIEETNTKN